MIIFIIIILMLNIKCLYHNIQHTIGEEYFAYKLLNSKNLVSYRCKNYCDNPLGFILLKLNIPFIPIKKDDILMLLDKYYKSCKKHTFHIYNSKIYEKLTTDDIEKLENIGIHIINVRSKLVKDINSYVRKLIFGYGILDTKSILELINKNFVENVKYCYLDPDFRENEIQEIMRNIKYVEITIPVFE